MVLPVSPENKSDDVSRAEARSRFLHTDTGDMNKSLEPMKNTILRSHGRPPWYDEYGKPLSDAFVIGIAGGSASGKTHVAQQILRSLGNIPAVVIISQDSFYKELTPEQSKLAYENRYNLDHPDAIDMAEFTAAISDLKKGRQTTIPVYSFAQHQRLKEKRYLYGASIIITEGIMTLYDPTLRSLYELKIFVKCDSDLMLARRIKRDTKERGRDVEGILNQYLRFVKPAYDDFVLPTSRYADIIVPGSDNDVAINLICTHIQSKLNEHSRSFRENMPFLRGDESHISSNGSLSSEDSTWILDLNLHILQQTSQLKGIYTILRDKKTSRGDFIFFTDRLSTFLIESALIYLPFGPKSVVTPTGAQAHGKALTVDGTSVCGISILRSGGPLENGLRRVINDIRIGSLLIQSDAKTGEPLLLSVMLPVCLRDRQRAQSAYVFLLDAQIGTGASAFMAIRVLLDHGVQPGHIVFVTFLVARNGGVIALRRAFPEVRIVCGAIDETLNERWVEVAQMHEGEGEDAGAREQRIWTIEPGMGQIGDRYYL